MPNDAACERRKDAEHWRVLSTFVESAESDVFARMPNQELRHHIALCESGIYFRHGHGQVVAFAELVLRNASACGMRKWNKLSSRPWGGSCICRTFSAECVGPMCSMP